MCILCGRVVGQEDVQELTICPTPKCPGQYCSTCYVDLNKICPICKMPTEYGDLSDESLERYEISSEYGAVVTGLLRSEGDTTSYMKEYQYHTIYVEV
jgi:hypothetical protein